MQPIVVLDFGKTNKKILVFNDNFKVLDKRSVQIDVKTLPDGTQVDDIDRINQWLYPELLRLTRRYQPRVVSCTTFGATIVTLNRHGNLAFPVYAYTTDPGEETKLKFYHTFGTAESLYLKTATPPYGQLLNVGVQLFWLKKKFSHQFKTVTDILFLPQYLGYLLTGKKAVELTSVGCHTYLYDFTQTQWSSLVNRLGLTSRLPEKFLHPWDILGTVTSKIAAQTGLSDLCKVNVGVHDSNASLVPYLVAQKNQNFVLASTGTWCVFMYPGSKFKLKPADLYKDTLYYLDIYGRPVKASRFKGGDEHEFYHKLLQNRFNGNPRKTVKFNPSILTQLLNSADSFILPTLTPGSGQFPGSTPRIINEPVFWQNIQTGYHLLNLSLAVQSYFALTQILDDTEQNVPIYVEGGFRNNECYLMILATLLPGRIVMTTEVSEATSLGAAVCGYCTLRGINPSQIPAGKITLKTRIVQGIKINPRQVLGYLRKFKRYCQDKNV